MANATAVLEVKDFKAEVQPDWCPGCGDYLRWEPTGYMQAVTPEIVPKREQDCQPAQLEVERGKLLSIGLEPIAGGAVTD